MDHALPISTGLAAGSTVKYATKAAFNRAEVESCVKAEAVSRGILWVRKHVFDKYKVRKPSELTDDQLAELAAFMRGTAA